MPQTLRPTLGFLLHEVARLLRRRFEQNARDLGLTRAQCQVLAYLSRCEGIHQGGLAELIDVEPITLVPILDKLEERGLLERRKDPSDRRMRTLYLTDAARPLLDSILSLGEITRNEALDGLSADQRQALADTLLLMKTNLLDACTRAPAVLPSACDETPA
ncbi:MarR family winged helix-turn-helix transcriptional regulator [Novispirillum itersonii]|uniref:MarR family winged helix-turn-helix transcriptional regulator n=1 Tax=Novispirillum itersonii TaxID=189 RepID=UPI000362AEF5|nr:MarR family transcriptional regulator [Novispirillum itersonii]